MHVNVYIKNIAYVLCDFVKKTKYNFLSRKQNAKSGA